MSEHVHTQAPASSAPVETPDQKLQREKNEAITKASKENINVKEGKDVKSLAPIGAVYRNGVAVPFFETDIARAKGDKVGLSYPAPHMAWIKDNASTFTTWLGTPTILRWVSSKLKTTLQNLMEEACPDRVGSDGQIVMSKPNKKGETEPLADYEKFNLQEYWDLVEELSPRSETLAEINEAIMSLATDMADMDIDAFFTKFGPQQGLVEFKLAQQNIKVQIQSYNIAKDKKKRHKAESLAADEAPSAQQAA